MNASTNGFASSEARLDALEDNYWNYTEANGIFTNGDFEDDAGAAANISELTSFRESVGGDGFSIVRLEDGDRPPSSLTHGKVLNYALRVGRSGCTDPDNSDCEASCHALLSMPRSPPSHSPSMTLHTAPGWRMLAALVAAVALLSLAHSPCASMLSHMLTPTWPPSLAHLTRV